MRRRQFLSWTAPVISVTTLPVHAQTSCPTLFIGSAQIGNMITTRDPNDPNIIIGGTKSGLGDIAYGNSFTQGTTSDLTYRFVTPIPNGINIEIDAPETIQSTFGLTPYTATVSFDGYDLCSNSGISVFIIEIEFTATPQNSTCGADSFTTTILFNTDGGGVNC